LTDDVFCDKLKVGLNIGGNNVVVFNIDEWVRKIGAQGSQQETRISVTVPEIGGIQKFVFEFVEVKCEVLYLCLDLPDILKKAYIMNFILTCKDANFLLSRIWDPDSPYKPDTRVLLKNHIRVNDFLTFISEHTVNIWYDGI
jgi:hypothetical protein